MNTKLDSILCVHSLSNRFEKTHVLRNASLELFQGETLAVLGESGCGKTTLLRILAGLIPADSGIIELNGRSLAGVSARDRGIVYLDQEAMLFEHLTVYENIAFAMRLKGKPRSTIRSTVDEMLQATGLVDHASKRSWQLSGGQKQRVAFARAILSYPQILLLDEPFCSLDGRNRTSMQELFRDIGERYKLTALFVTHDLKEALLVGSRFALMSAGELKVYPSRRDFLCDVATGIPEEIEFWENVACESNK